MILTIAGAVALSLQLETGWIHMTSAPDDFWYEQALPHTTDFDSAAFGAGLRADVGRFQFTLGWRNLGNQHQSADIIADAKYFACKDHPSTCPKPVSYWTETGDVQQTYAELGYAFRILGTWKLVPSIGIAETRIGSHVNFYDPAPDGTLTKLRTYEPCSAGPQTLPRVFAGLTLQHGNLGVGVDYLNTEPNRGANNCSSPIQGSSATYLRITYNIGGTK